MNRYVLITFSAVFLVMAFIPCQVSAASITETKAAIGKNCVASGDYSTAMGYDTTAGGNYSTAMGVNTVASGMASTATGYNTTAGGDYSWAGSRDIHLTASADHTFVWGYSDSPQSISTANAFLIFPAGNIGRVGIGTPSPGEELEIYSNYPYVKFNGHPASDARQIGVNDYGFVVYNPAEARYDMIINNDGHVGIGEANPSKKLYVNGSAGGTQAWNASDEREKTGIRPIKYALDNVSKLRGVSYRWKEGDAKGSRGFDNKTHFGVIAQEIEKVYPELVDNPGHTEQRKHVEYNALVGVLIEAVKELKVQNDDQKAKIEAQQAEIDELRSLIKELKS